MSTTTTKTAAKRIDPVFVGNVGAPGSLPLPIRTNTRGSTSVYPFDTLTAAGSYFGLKNKTAAQLQSIIGNVNRKHLVPKKNAEGHVVYKTKELTDAEGKKIGDVPDTENPELIANKHFFAFDVDADYKKKLKGTEFEGATVLVFRDI